PKEINRFVREDLRRTRSFDGLFVHHEPALPYLGRAFASLGVQLPEDVQVVAIAPEPVATNGPREVSSIDLPIAAIGQNAVAMALEQFDAPEKPPHSRLLSPRFVDRGTTMA